MLSLPGAVWLAPALLAAAIVVLRRPRPLLLKAGAFAAGLAVLAIPAYVAAVDWLPRIGAFDKETNLGNLIGPLSAWQLFGIWPSGDFRVHPHDSAPAYVLIAVVIGAGAARHLVGVEKRSWELLAYVVIAGVGCALFLAVSSPWVGGKTLAMASPAALAAALAGCAAIFGTGRVVEASVVALAIVGGVFWSNALQYHDVWLAPRGQLHELETIGHDFAGQGPALMTNYEPYGARHFLRSLDPEGASELRRRFVYLTNGKLLDKGGSADIDRIRLDGLLVYRTLVLRRGPAASRPPSVYRLVWSGRYYEVWQRPQPPVKTILQHLPLGSDTPGGGGSVLCGGAPARSPRRNPDDRDPAGGDLARPAARPRGDRADGFGADRRRLHRLGRRRLVRARLRLGGRAQGRLHARGAGLAGPVHRPRLGAAHGG